MNEIACREVTREMMPGIVDLALEPGNDDLDSAMAAAWEQAKKRKQDPMLLSWFDRRAGRWSPPVDCCGDDEPAWLIYAKSRGADLFISVNREQYVFAFFGEDV